MKGGTNQTKKQKETERGGAEQETEDVCVHLTIKKQYG